MPNTIPVGPNPFLVLLDIIQRPNIEPSDITRLRVLSALFASKLEALFDIENSLYSMADDIELGELEDYDDSDLLRARAETIRQLRLDLNEYLALSLIHI